MSNKVVSSWKKNCEKKVVISPMDYLNRVFGTDQGLIVQKRDQLSRSKFTELGSMLPADIYYFASGHARGHF